MDVIFTIVSRNYAAQAATLMQSLRLVEPSARRVVIATDGPIPSLEGLAEVIPAETLDAPFRAMTVYYDALELNTAVKPYAFRKLLAEAETVTYLDPDIYVFQPLEAVRAALAEAELALTPHVTRPLLGEAMPNDQAILKSGVWNLGFAAMRATPATLALADWWAEKCRFDCRVDFANGLFTDQRWMDLAPGLVERFAPLRSPTLNLAYWNLEGRRLSGSSTGWRVDGDPLVFFHFSGFDPDHAAVLSKYQTRIPVASGSALASLLCDYAEQLLRNDYRRSSLVEYGHGRFASGRPITREMRQRALLLARAGEDFSDGLTAATEARLAADSGVRRKPDPRAPKPDGDMIGWLRGVSAKGQPNALAALLGARADLRDRFAKDPDGLIAWALGVEAPAGRFAPDLLPAAFVEGLDPGIGLRAARFAAPEASDLHHRLSAAFGLAERGGWPEALWRRQRNELLAQAPGRPVPWPMVFDEIWRARTDLRPVFPLRGVVSRFRYLRWLAAGGLASFDVPAHLVTGTPAFDLARATVGAGRARKDPGRPVAELWVVEDRDPALEPSADRRVYVASTGSFLDLAGTADAPPRASLVRFLTGPSLVAADAMALHARGVRWDRAEFAPR